MPIYRTSKPQRSKCPSARARDLAYRLTILSFFFLLIQADALSHPVAQGAMEIVVLPEGVSAIVRVSTEEVFVTSSLSMNSKAPADTEGLWRQHGEYLVEHLHVRLNGRLLAGRLGRFFPPQASDSPDGTATEQVVYELAFSGLSPHETPQTLQVEEDVLKEFTFTPGNPWTASYVVSIDQPGYAGIVRGLLLDRHQPLYFRLRPTPGDETANAIRPARVIHDYFLHGLVHIYTGYDHILFMCALALGAISIWDLLTVVTAFTVAHSITLTLSVFNVLRLSEHLVEPLIAASIVVVALQNAVASRHSRGWLRIGVAFFFGLFHGLGFAGGLLEAMSGLPPVAIGLAIFGFSLGVETAQQSVVVPVFAIMRALKGQQGSSLAGSRIFARSLSALIAGLGTLYLFQALAA